MTDAPDAAAPAGRRTSKPHGTCTRYRHGPDQDGRPGGCRCEPCRAADSQARRDRSRLKAYGRWQPPLTDAGPAREHVGKLRAYGAGLSRIAPAAGVSHGQLQRLVYGYAGSPPARRVRLETEARILAVRPSLALLGASASVDASGTHRRLQALIATGRGRGELAARLGVDRTNLNRILRRGRVSAATARAVAALYEETWDLAPDESTPRAARAAARARQEAQSCGWPLPAAWDDDEIDDPAAGPAEGWQRSSRGTSAGLAEDAAELIARGYTREDIAERLEVKRDTLDAAIVRSARRAGAQATASADTTGERSDAAA